MADSPLHDERGQLLPARRLMENQQLFESINDKMETLTRDIATEDDEPQPLLISFLCECSDTTCRERMDIPLAHYHAIHATPERFTIRPGHEILSVERVVERFDDRGYEIVEKLKPVPA
jgi:hypothetical protein